MSDFSFPYEQVFLELTFAASGMRDEDQILDKCLPLYLRKLNCRFAGVVKRTELELDFYRLLPQLYKNSKTATELLAACKKAYDRYDTETTVELDSGTYYLYELPDYGWLVLGRAMAFPQIIVKEFYHVVQHLGNALTLAQEIALRNATEDRLRNVVKRLSLLEKLIDGVRDSIQVADESGLLVYANKAALKRIGIDLSTLELTHVCDFEPIFKDQASWKAHVDHLIDEKQFSTETEHLNTVTGEATPVEVNVNAELIDGRVHIIAISRDLTARREHERRLKAATDTYQSVVSALPDLILRINNTHCFTDCYTNHPEEFIAPPEALIGASLNKALPASLAKLLGNATDRVLKEGSTMEVLEYQFDRKPTHSIEWYEARVVRVNAIEALCLVRNISGRKKNEQEIQRKEQMLMALAKATNELLSNSNVLQAVDRSIGWLGEASGVDRTYAFTAFRRDGEVRVSQRHEWTAPGIKPEIENEQLQDSPTFIDFEAPENFKIPWKAVVSELPEDELKEVLSMQGISTIVLIPIYLRDQFWGFVGFDDCTQERQWSPAELSLLMSFASSISNALEREEQAEQLRLSKQDAERANKAKSLFLANMSHEIRTPLNSIIGFSELLTVSEISGEELNYVKAITTSGRLLLGTINDILDLSKVEAGHIELDLIPIQLENIARNVVDILKHTASTKGIELRLEVHQIQDLTVMGDSVRLQQILLNLAGNAVKFTKQGHVTLRIERLEEREDEATIRFAVEDTGIGIPTEKQEKIFAAFTQEDESITRKFGGTGLGLTIAKHLIEKMQGKLHLNSAEMKGSTFWFELNLEKVSDDLLQACPETADSEALRQTLSDRPMHLVVVDDSVLNLTLAESILCTLIPNATVEKHERGTHFLEATGPAPDLVFMDIQMPELSGYETAEKARYNERYQDAPIVALTAGTVKGEEERCLASGMKGYLSKPLQLPKLIECIKSYLPKDVQE